MSSRHKRIDIQMETLSYIQNNEKMKETKFHRFEHQKFINRDPGIYKTNIQVVKMDTLKATVQYQQLHDVKFCFLVMANAFHEGGGYLRGASAQEESVCRRTNLPLGFEQIKYPLDQYGGVYVENIFILKDDESTNCKYLDKQYKSDAILIAAYSRPPLLIDGSLRPKYRRRTMKKIAGLFEECLARGCKNLILGALGCGAFYNPPGEIAEIFKELLDEKFKNQFENVIFAIIDGETTDNYNVFKKILE